MGITVREREVLSEFVETDKLEKAIFQITGFGISVEEYLIKLCHVSPTKVYEKLYSKKEHT